MIFRQYIKIIFFFKARARGRSAGDAIQHHWIFIPLIAIVPGAAMYYTVSPTDQDPNQNTTIENVYFLKHWLFFSIANGKNFFLYG
jgi:hypothetical protein